jgi:hypothetical protein
MSNPASRVSQFVISQAVPAAIATPIPLSATPLLCMSVVIVASRGRTVNAGSVFLGTAATNDSQLFPLIPGQSIQLFGDEDNLLDLSQIYIDAATLTDGVQFIASGIPNQ